MENLESSIPVVCDFIRVQQTASWSPGVDIPELIAKGRCSAVQIF